MQASKQRALWLGTLAALVFSVGCSGRAPVYPVKGKVTFAGTPMRGGGSITFVPLTEQGGKNAFGTITKDGTYELMTHEPGDGAMAGEFRVVITQLVEDEPKNPGDDKAPGKPIVVVAQADRIAAIYSDFYKSPLTAKVEAKGLNEIDFKLERE
jgi:hypothetical protein